MGYRGVKILILCLVKRCLRISQVVLKYSQFKHSRLQDLLKLSILIFNLDHIDIILRIHLLLVVWCEQFRQLVGIFRAARGLGICVSSRTMGTHLLLLLLSTRHRHELLS